MSIKWAAIIHSIVSALAVIPSIGLAIGLTIGAADSNTGALATLVVWLSGLFPGVLIVSIIVVWVAYGTRHPRVVWAAIAFPWMYLLVLIATTALIAAGRVGPPGDITFVLIRNANRQPIEFYASGFCEMKNVFVTIIQKSLRLDRFKMAV